MSVPEKFTGYGATDGTGRLSKFQYDPKPFGDHDIDIKISHCGICGSDLHTLYSGWGPTDYPVVVGHEIVGEVVRVGSKVTKFKVGDQAGVGAQCCSCLECETCKAKMEQNCAGSVGTYNSRFPDGSKSYGGYADYERCHEHFAFHIPAGMKNEEAACLLCAGITTFSPFLQHKIGPQHKVGVVGVGGLGHLGVQWSAALGADTTAISHSDRKKEDAAKLGAKHYLNFSDEAQVKAAARTFDFILCTSFAPDMPMDTFLSMLKPRGTFCLVGAPEEPFPMRAFDLIPKNINFCGSTIGSPEEIEYMLKFAQEKGVKTWYEKRPMAEAQKAVDDLKEGKARYRFVLEN
ncbi:hypothetical protein BZG36_04127 [Bifiguratus adelaidae]|uniref:Enoyl reductase (ER) domain-containing protein n=1 Tax=Bifiguratus adelaidae TaxID=1938954 RepID=A0A261XX28_9FUNG|nr:hypothetical protein BZG36_04127 [Bifiguratus adelaidae]